MDADGLRASFSADASVDEKETSLYAGSEPCNSMILFGIGGIVEYDLVSERSEVCRAIHRALGVRRGALGVRERVDIRSGGEQVNAYIVRARFPARVHHEVHQRLSRLV